MAEFDVWSITFQWQHIDYLCYKNLQISGENAVTRYSNTESTG